ncbi:MAG: ABC transporter ATP-binding protein [Bacteroidales bacterium]|nr:ABC transporter ATP-binding protein [Bacteroidales bacterium]
MNLLKRLLKYLSPFGKNIAAIVVANILYAFFSLFSFTMIAPFLSVLFGHAEQMAAKPDFAFTLDAIIGTFNYYMGEIIAHSGKVYALLYVAVSMVILSLLSNFFRYMAMYTLAPVRAGFLKNLRKDIYHQIIVLPLSFYSQERRGDILNRMGSDVQEVEWSIISTLQSLCRDPFLIILYMIALFKISAPLTLVSLLILPLVGYLIAIIGKSIKRNSVKAQQILGHMSSIFEESIGGLKIIKGYNAIDLADEQFKAEDEKFYKLHRKIFRITELGSPLIEILCIIALTVILFIGSRMVLNSGGTIPAEIFMMFILIFSRLIQPAKTLVSSIYTVQKGMASAQRIYQILDGDEVIEEVADPIRINKLEKEIEYRHVSFAYKENEEVLHDINFTLHKGEFIALVGASGSGKSTIVDLLPRFYDIQQGEILVDGIDSRQLKISDLRGLFGIVNQDVTLFNDTIHNNIAFGMENVTREMVEQAAKVAHAHDFIMEMENGYDTIVGDRGMKLSGGQRQRLSIARAVLKNPEVLILDEATSALDTESEHIVQTALQELMHNRTAIVIAHRLSTIRKANLILFIENGRIVERGTHEELMEAHGAYYRFCAVQQ